MVVEQSKAKVALLPLFSVPVGVYNLSESSHKMNSNLIADIYKEKEKIQREFKIVILEDGIVKRV